MLVDANNAFNVLRKIKQFKLLRSGNMYILVVIRWLWKDHPRNSSVRGTPRYHNQEHLEPSPTDRFIRELAIRMAAGHFSRRKCTWIATLVILGEGIF